MIKTIYRILTLLAFALLMFDLGYSQDETQEKFLLWAYFATTVFFTAFETYRILSPGEATNVLNQLRLALPIVTFAIISFQWLVKGDMLEDAIKSRYILFLVNVLLLVVFELTFYIRKLYLSVFSPAILFVGSFLFVIAGGTFLLMLPNATTHGIRFVDALFTATSAVSVTGLAVVDTGTAFTRMGHIILLVLIQLGGLGMLTFTSFFSYFFRGTSSFQEDLHLRDFLSSDQLSGLLELALKIVGFTLAVETVGAVFIYYNLPEGYFGTVQEGVFFSMFHAISSFCNAGFSTLANNFYEEAFRFRYNIHLAIAFLLIIGGLGFSIFFNLISYMRLRVESWYERFVLNRPKYYKTVRQLTLNTKIVLVTTTVLLVIGTALFWVLERNHTLACHTTVWGKFVTSFFGSATPRTAGFNTVNMAELAIPTVMVTILLMWIGASPASTGGGIKTSTFALATLNIFSVASAKNRIDLGSREVPPNSVDRAFAIISLSLIVIGIGILLVSAAEPEQTNFLDIAFEVFSSYSTVGLSLGITPKLTDFSKFVLIFVMFIGRVGALNILIGMLRQIKTLPYRYPEESVIIN
jgi:potassium uptake TrkH family protein